MRLFASLLIALFAGAHTWAADAQVAVAANFTAAARELGAAYETLSGHRIGFSFGSSGQLYTQIDQGAPFDAFLAADRERPARAEAEGLAVAGSRFTYATGRLVLYCPVPGCWPDPGMLMEGSYGRLAIANPVTAPYGAAAVHAMKSLGLYDTLVPRLVLGTNIAQAYQFVATGNAGLGFVALSQMRPGDAYWLVPDDLHEAVRQDAVLLIHGADNEAAAGFLAFLKSAEAKAVMERYGYGAGEGRDG